MRSLRSLLSVCAVGLLACSSVSVDAHVRLLNTGLPIRNAASATADGAFSVSGPCGGTAAYGKTGVTSVASGSEMSLKIAYNGGHQDEKNAFHASIHCQPSIAVGSTFDDSVLRSGQASGAFLQLKPSGNTVPAPDSSTKGYTLTFDVPVNDDGASRSCVVALIDQRNWGGCVDITLLPAAAPVAPVVTGPQSECQKYCGEVQAYCTGADAQFESTAACMTSCANYTRTAGVTTGDNLECRSAKLAAVGAGGGATTNCPLAGPTASGVCRDTTQAQKAAHTPAPCATYCDAVEANCSSSRLYSTRAQCMQSCAAFMDTSVGSELTPPQGDNIVCRSAAASSSTCASAAASASGLCVAANPLVLLPDVLSATYVTDPSQCESEEAAAANTIAGCCCLSGNITFIHVQGSTKATVSSNLRVQGGAMCQQGTAIPVAQWSFATATPTKTGGFVNYTFAQAVAVTQLDSVVVSQKADTAAYDMTGRLSLGGDPFLFELLVDEAGQPTVILTNDVPEEQKPRVCSIQAAYASRIDSTGMTPPDGEVSAASGAASAAAGIIAAGAAAVVALML